MHSGLIKQFFQLALILISTCGFGNPLNWQFTESSTNEMPFEKALTIVSESTIALLLTPKWAYSLPIKWYVVSRTEQSAGMCLLLRP